MSYREVRVLFVNSNQYSKAKIAEWRTPDTYCWLIESVLGCVCVCVCVCAIRLIVIESNIHCFRFDHMLHPNGVFKQNALQISLLFFSRFFFTHPHKNRLNQRKVIQTWTSELIFLNKCIYFGSMQWQNDVNRKKCSLQIIYYV